MPQRENRDHTEWSRLGTSLQHFLEDEADPVIGDWAVGQGRNAPDRQLFRTLVRSLAESRPEQVSVLEVGCGSGVQLGGLIDDGLEPGFVTYTGYDFTPELVEVCREKYPGRRFELRDLREMEDDGTADVVVSRAVLEHIEEGELGLKNLFRASRIVTVVSWFMRPTWNESDAGIEFVDGFLHQRYAARELLAFIRDELRPALVCRFDFDYHLYDWSVWLLWREPPPDGVLAAVHRYLASAEFEQAAGPRTANHGAPAVEQLSREIADIRNYVSELEDLRASYSSEIAELVAERDRLLAQAAVSATVRGAARLVGQNALARVRRLLAVRRA